MRDHTKLRAFELADNLALSVYKATAGFPREETFGLKSCARSSEADYLRFLDTAYGSAREVEYQASLAYRLGYMRDEEYETLRSCCEETSKVLSGLIRSLRKP